MAVYGDVFELRDFFFSDQIKRAAVPISNKVAEGAERGSKFALILLAFLT